MDSELLVQWLFLAAPHLHGKMGPTVLRETSRALDEECKTRPVNAHHLLACVGDLMDHFVFGINVP